MRNKREEMLVSFLQRWQLCTTRWASWKRPRICTQGPTTYRQALQKHCKKFVYFHAHTRTGNSFFDFHPCMHMLTASMCTGDAAGPHTPGSGDNNGQYGRPAQSHVQIRRGRDGLPHGKDPTLT